MVSSITMPHFYYDAFLRKSALWNTHSLLKSFNEAAHPRDAAGRFSAGGGSATTVSSKPDGTEHAATQDLALLASLLQTGKSAVIHHATLGAITVDAGSTGKSGYGIKHIIEQRYAKDGKSEEEITALIPLVLDAAKSGKVIKNITRIVNGQEVGTLSLEKNGIVAFVSKKRGFTDEKFIITGFDDAEKKQEATDAIQTVIATHSYTPEFVNVKRQVGAVIASLGQSSSKAREKSSIEGLKKSLAAFETACNCSNTEQTMQHIHWKLIKWQLEKSFYPRQAL